MDIRQLEFFAAVAEERNFTRAAERTFVTQSGMSSSIRALERELGVQLFDRSGREVTLTRAGHIFLPRARRMLDDARTATQELLSVSDDADTVRVGSEQCVGDLVDLVDLLTAFRDGEPTVELSLTQTRSETLLDLLGKGELDVALIALPIGRAVGPASQGITTVELRSEPFVAVLPPDHDLAERDVIGWDELELLPFVDLTPAWVARQIVDDAFAARRRNRRTTMTVDDVHMLLDLVGRGFGIAVIPESMAAKQQAEGLARIAVAAPELAWQIHSAISDQAGAAARAFAAMMLPATTAIAARLTVAELASAQ